MILKAVMLEFFECERQYASCDSRQLERQICLIFDAAEPIHISWTWERQIGPSDPPYSIGYKNESFFDTAPDIVIDASSADIWRVLIGERLAFAHPDQEAQILRLKSPSAQVFCYTWGKDSVSISAIDPREHTSYPES